MTQQDEIGGLETVPQNTFGINPVTRVRPYIGDPVSRAKYMKFMGYEHGVLTSRISELNSRAEQIMYIWLCRQDGAYLAVANREITKGREADKYFYDWLDELYIQGVAYGARENLRSNGNNPTYRWDRIQKVVDLCLAKGLDLEIAAKIASVGLNAVEMYLKTGVITLDAKEEVRSIAADTARPVVTNEDRGKPDVTPEDVDEARQVDLLETIATATSSRGATLIARTHIGNKFIRISAINKRTEEDLPGWVGYDIEVQVYASATTQSEYTPYETRHYFKNDVPIEVVKFTLAKLSEALSRIL